MISQRRVKITAAELDRMSDAEIGRLPVATVKEFLSDLLAPLSDGEQRLLAHIIIRANAYYVPTKSN
jgi:hypothetical protein